MIVVVIDGARYTETFGAGSLYIPHLHSDFMPLGAVYTNFRIANEGRTETNPGHASILTGTWQQIANDGSQRPNIPTIFEYFRKELGSTLIENYVIAGKEKLDAISYSTDLFYGVNYRASESCSDRTDNAVYSNLISIMDTYRPRLVIVNFPDTDRRGHAKDWVGYLNAITNADNLVFQIWQKIQIDTYYQNNTTLFVTNDHGRHANDYSGHGDDCEGCEHIMLLGIGRNVTQGLVNNDPHYQIELAATIGDLLGFNTPQAAGTSLFEGINPLPVELSSFTAIESKGQVTLKWITETEIDNYGFEVERALSSTTRLQGWEKIGFVQGSGNSNSPKEYSYIDKKLIGGSKFKYRLKQIDNTGQYEYSNEVEVNLIPTEYALFQNYPNPFNPSTTIRYQLPKESKVAIKIYSILGSEVMELLNEQKEAGTYEIEFNAEALSSGTYIYRIIAGDFIQTKKMILLR